MNRTAQLYKNGVSGVAPLYLLFVVLCIPLRAASANRPEASIQDGLFLLKDSCQREVQLHFLPLFKTTPQPVSKYLGDLSTYADESIQTINRLQSQDNSLKEEKNPLPLIEQQTRKNFIDAGRKRVLFGAKGAAYVRALLVDQLEETIYMTSLAEIMATTESNPVRAKTLEQMAIRWAALRDRGYRLLNEVH